MEETVEQIRGKSYLRRTYFIHRMSPHDQFQLLKENGLFVNINHPRIHKPVRHTNEDLTMETETHVFPHYQQNLWRYINEENGGKLDAYETIRFFSQMIDAIGYLHSKQIIKRDLSIRCFLLDDNNDLKLTNLKNFEVADSLGRVRNFISNIDRSPPESLTLDANVNGVMMDVWCLGVCLYKMACGVDKYPKYHPVDGLDWATLQHDLPSWVRVKRLQNLLCSMLDPDPHKRPELSLISEKVNQLSRDGNKATGHTALQNEQRKQKKKSKKTRTMRYFLCLPG